MEERGGGERGGGRKFGGEGGGVKRIFSAILTIPCSRGREVSLWQLLYSTRTESVQLQQNCQRLTRSKWVSSKTS